MEQPESFIADYQRRVAAVAEKAQAARERMAAIHGTETSSDGAVTVSVNVQGALESVRFGPSAASLSLDSLATTIVSTSQKARVRAARAAADVLEPLVGADSAAMAEVRARIPTEAPFDGTDGRPDRDGLNEDDTASPTASAAPPRTVRTQSDDGDDAETGYTRGG